jgi:hypothetical protein
MEKGCRWSKDAGGKRDEFRWLERVFSLHVYTDVQQKT